MTTAVSTEEITHPLLPYFGSPHKENTILRQALNRAGYTVLPPQKGNARITRVAIPALEPSENDTVVDVVVSFRGTQNSPANKLANPQAWALLLTGGKIALVSGNSSETNPFEWYSPESTAIDYASRPMFPWVAPAQVASDFSLPRAVLRFADGADGERPTPSTIDAASVIAMAALRLTNDPEFILDSDGSLYYDLRLPIGQRVMAELTIDGDLDAGFYDDRNEEEQAEEVRYLEQTTAEELIQFFR